MAQISSKLEATVKVNREFLRVLNACTAKPHNYFRHLRLAGKTRPAARAGNVGCRGCVLVVPDSRPGGGRLSPRSGPSRGRGLTGGNARRPPSPRRCCGPRQQLISVLQSEFLSTLGHIFFFFCVERSGRGWPGEGLGGAAATFLRADRGGKTPGRADPALLRLLPATLRLVNYLTL